MQWTRDELKRYYLYHLLLHEVGHIIDPRKGTQSSREAFAENFALEQARRLGVI